MKKGKKAGKKGQKVKKGKKETTPPEPHLKERVRLTSSVGKQTTTILHPQPARGVLSCVSACAERQREAENKIKKMLSTGTELKANGGCDGGADPSNQKRRSALTSAFEELATKADDHADEVSVCCTPPAPCQKITPTSSRPPSRPPSPCFFSPHTCVITQELNEDCPAAKK